MNFMPLQITIQKALKLFLTVSMTMKKVKKFISNGKKSLKEFQNWYPKANILPKPI